MCVSVERIPLLTAASAELTCKQGVPSHINQQKKSTPLSLSQMRTVIWACSRHIQTSVAQTDSLPLTGQSGSVTSSGAAQYSFKSSAFFGGKMNVRSSVVRVAQSSRGDVPANSIATAAEERQPIGIAAPRRMTLVEQYSLDSTKYGSCIQPINASSYIRLRRTACEAASTLLQSHSNSNTVCAP